MKTDLIETGLQANATVCRAVTAIAAQEIMAGNFERTFFVAQPEHRVVTASDQKGALCGFAVFQDARPQGYNALWLDLIWTKEDCRRKGIATDLINFVCKRADFIGVQSVMLGTGEGNYLMRRLCRKLDADEWRSQLAQSVMIQRFQVAE